MMWILVRVELLLTAPVSSLLQDEVGVLLAQACKMDDFDLSATNRLTETLIHLTKCTCEDVPVSNATMRVDQQLFCFLFAPSFTLLSLSNINCR